MTDQVRAALAKIVSEWDRFCAEELQTDEGVEQSIEAARAALALEHVAGEATSIEFQQQRGRHSDIIQEAIANYDEWMLDDDYEASAKLHEIIRRMRERLEFSAAPSPALDPVTVEAAAAEFRFWMDARRFASSRSKLTGAEIKTIANTQPMYPVYRDTGPHFSSHVAVGDGELVDIDGEHFYALIPATYYRGGL